jgi:zinc transport system substrate-binding protein
LFIYVGGESDKWVDDALKDSVNPDMVTINLLDVLGGSVKVEELVEGMEEKHDNERTSNEGSDHEGSENESYENDTADHNMEETYEDDRDYDSDNDHDHEEEYDEHVWISKKNARIFCSEIADVLSSLDSANAGEYRSNASAYVETLSVLDAGYQTLMDTCSVKTLLFGDRFPFRYLADDYGINYYAAFPGCSAETEASFETVIFLAGKVDELNLKSIMVTESADQTIANTIINNTKTKQQHIFVLDAMQSVTGSDLVNGTTYLSIMESNLDVLKEALN